MNKVKVYRVEHLNDLYSKEWFDNEIQFGIGPYIYIQHGTDFMKAKFARLSELLRRNEPSNANPKKNRLARIGLFATFVDRRPGPKEDPYLRDKLTFDSKLIENPHMYGFDSMEQLNHWFHDPEEREELDKQGFGIGIYYAREPLVGLRQALFRRDKTIKLVNKKRLIG